MHASVATTRIIIFDVDIKNIFLIYHFKNVFPGHLLQYDNLWVRCIVYITFQTTATRGSLATCCKLLSENRPADGVDFLQILFTSHRSSFNYFVESFSWVYTAYISTFDRLKLVKRHDGREYGLLTNLKYSKSRGTSYARYYGRPLQTM
jgi:hypothetical protein